MIENDAAFGQAYNDYNFGLYMCHKITSKVYSKFYIAI